MKSIFKQDDGECFLCNLQGQYITHSYLEDHHIFFGTANRKKSEQHGLKVKLCTYHHRGDIKGNKEAVHHNIESDKTLKKIAQRKFEETHTREVFRKEFGKSWL